VDARLPLGAGAGVHAGSGDARGVPDDGVGEVADKRQAAHDALSLSKSFSARPCRRLCGVRGTAPWRRGWPSHRSDRCDGNSFPDAVSGTGSAVSLLRRRREQVGNGRGEGEPHAARRKSTFRCRGGNIQWLAWPDARQGSQGLL